MPPPGPRRTSSTPGVDEHLDRLAQRRAADLHLRGERALARQLVADAQLADADLVRDLLGGLLERSARLDGREHAGNIHADRAVVSLPDLFPDRTSQLGRATGALGAGSSLSRSSGGGGPSPS